MEYTENAFGVRTLTVRSRDLQNFEHFVTQCQQQNMGNGRGIFKCRIHEDEETHNIPDLLETIRKHCTSTGFRALNQHFDKFSLRSNVFLYRKDTHMLLTEDKKEFVHVMDSLNHLKDNQSTCCSEKLRKFGVEALLKHYWDTISKVSHTAKTVIDPNQNVLDKMFQIGKELRREHATSQPCSSMTSSDVTSPVGSQVKDGSKCKKQISSKHPWMEVRQTMKKSHLGNAGEFTKDKAERVPLFSELSPLKPILYWAGFHMPAGEDISICRNFSLSKLGTLLDLQPDMFFGVSTPLLYVGTVHSTSAWHDEDAWLFSINYLLCGEAKIWTVVAPKDHLKLVQCLRKTNIGIGHTSCCNLHGHKVVMVDNKFLEENKIPYSVVVEEPREFVIVEPGAAHHVFNTGLNVAQAVNFATESWIKYGMVAPDCECNGRLQVHVDMTPFLAMCKPYLLKPYLGGDLSMNIQLVLGAKQLACDRETEPVSDDIPPNHSNGDDLIKVYNGSGDIQKKNKPRMVLHCPFCSQHYNGGRAKVNRLKQHAEKHHRDIENRHLVIGNR